MPVVERRQWDTTVCQHSRSILGPRDPIVAIVRSLTARSGPPTTSRESTCSRLASVLHGEPKCNKRHTGLEGRHRLGKSKQRQPPAKRLPASPSSHFSASRVHKFYPGILYSPRRELPFPEWARPNPHAYKFQARCGPVEVLQ